MKQHIDKKQFISKLYFVHLAIFLSNTFAYLSSHLLFYNVVIFYKPFLHKSVKSCCNKQISNHFQFLDQKGHPGALIKSSLTIYVKISKLLESLLYKQNIFNLLKVFIRQKLDCGKYMTNELAFLEIGLAKLHVVYKPDKEVPKKEPFISEGFSKFDKKTKELLREKLIQSIRDKKAIPVLRKKNTKINLLTDIRILQEQKQNSKDYKDKFDAISKSIAKNYQNIIDGRSKDCLVMFVEAIGRKGVKHAIMIFELQIGIQALLKVEAGKKVIDIDFIDRLILSRQTRLFKVAYTIFHDEFDAIVCDTQSTTEKIAANYFIQKLLESDFIEIPAISTKRFYDETVSFINSLPDNIVKYQSSIHLYSYIHSDDEVIGPRDFVEKLKSDYQKQYLQYFKDKEIPIYSFPKDTTRIQSKIIKEKIEFDNGLLLSGPPKSIKKYVKMEKIDDKSEVVNISFQSKIKKIG